MSSMFGQHCTNGIQMFCVYWEAMYFVSATLKSERYNHLTLMLLGRYIQFQASFIQINTCTTEIDKMFCGKASFFSI